MHRIRSWVMAIASLSLVAACGSKGVSQGASVTVVTGAPQPVSTAPAVHPVTTPAAPSSLSVMEGMVAVGTSSGVLVGSKTTADTVDPLTVVSSGNEPTTTGTVGFLTRRTSGGVVVSAQNGLFQDQDGYLLPSPLTQSLSGDTLTTVDAYGVGQAEELWITTPQGALYVGGGTVQAIGIDGVTANPDSAVATAQGQAVVTAGGTAYLFDLDNDKVTVVGTNLGKVNGFDHGDDGTVYLATEQGLYIRTRSGTATLLTLSGSSTAADVLSVSAAYGSVIAATATQLIQVDGTTATLLGSLNAGTAGRGVAIDTNADAWVNDQGALAHWLTGKPVSYATDVKPFFDAHCTVCHATGANSAPVINWDDYTTAMAMAPQAVIRLESNGVSPMPPQSQNDPLTASQYGVVVRWVGGGYQP